MSSTATATRKGTKPSRHKNAPAQAASVTAETISALDNKESLRLYALGWKKADLERLGPTACRRIISTKTRKDPAADMFSDERVDVAAKPLPTPGLEIGADSFTKDCVAAGKGERKNDPRFPKLPEYEQRIIKGSDPFNALLREYAEAYPGTRFRFINPVLPIVAAGPAWQVFHDGEGKTIQVGDQILHFMPEAVYDEHYRKPNLERSMRMDSQIQRNSQDSDLAMMPDDARLAPIVARQLGPDGAQHDAGIVREVPAVRAA